MSCLRLTSRTAVNSQTGVCTQAGGIVTSESLHFQLSLHLFHPLEGACVVVLLSLIPTKCHVCFLVWKWEINLKLTFPLFPLCFLAGVIVLLSLAFLMPAFYYIPKASLAAVVICAVAPMMDYQVVANMWRIRSRCLMACVSHVYSICLLGVV